MCRLFIHDAGDRIHKHAKDCVSSFAEGDELRGMLLGAKRFSKVGVLNVRDLRKTIAAELIDAGKYAY